MLKFDDDERLIISEGDVDHVSQGLPFDADGALVVALGGAVNGIVGGLPFDRKSRLLVSLAPFVEAMNGWPHTANGAIAIEYDAEVNNVQGGLSFSATSALAVAAPDVAVFDFTTGPQIDQRITFTRPCPTAWMDADGYIHVADPNDPVFELGGLRLWSDGRQNFEKMLTDESDNLLTDESGNQLETT